MFDIYMAVFVGFLAFIALFFYFDRKNVERQGVFLLRKTKKGRAFLTRLGQRLPRLWWVYGTIAIVAGFYYSFYFTYLLFATLIDSFVTGAAPPGGGLILPTPTEDVVALPGVIGVPVIYWIISIFLLVLVHEGSHGIMAARERVRIKTLGWGLLIALPLAFVEPDEKQLQKEKPMKQLRVFAAGSMGNFTLAFLILIISSLLIASFYETSPGIKFSGYVEGFPAEKANLTGTIIRIDGTSIDNAQNLSDYLDLVGPGKTISVVTVVAGQSDTETRKFNLVTEANPDGGEGGFIGISGIYPNIHVKEGVNPDIAKFLYGRDPRFYGLFFWVSVINFAIGLINLLPALPLDGGRMWLIVLERIDPKHSTSVIKASSVFIWFLIAFLILSGAIGGVSPF